MSGVVAVAGSCWLPPGDVQLVAHVARALEASGCSLVMGRCAAGADQAALCTESGELYSQIMSYDVGALNPPFIPERYIALIGESKRAMTP